MATAIEVKNLTKYYGKLLAVDHIEFQVARGELFGFLGPNGAGKTTTQRMLTGVLPPDDGSALVMGFDIKKDAFYAKRLMGIVPELANVYIDLTAWDNLMLMGELYGVPGAKRKEKATQLLKTFGIYEKKDAKSKFLSKGLKQRLLLCMALIQDPEILFLDEPTTGLDVQSARLIRHLIGELNQTGITVFLTTHNIEEANQLCSKVAVIDHGQIAIIDTPENLKKTFQGTQSVEVAFSPPQVEKNVLEKLNAVTEIKKLGDKFRLYTNNPAVVVSQLSDLARTNDLQIIALNTLGPTLEDVFVKITEEHEGWNYGKQ